MTEKKKRVEIKSKWVQGSQIVLNVRLNYENDVTKDVQSSCPIEMTKNPAQFKAFLEEVWESQKPKTVDLSQVPDGVE